jgi:hypothetical protein
MQIIFSLGSEEKQETDCEVFLCKNKADYYVDDFDGEFANICKDCFEDITSNRR